MYEVGHHLPSHALEVIVACYLVEQLFQAWWHPTAGRSARVLRAAVDVQAKRRDSTSRATKAGMRDEKIGPWAACDAHRGGRGVAPSPGSPDGCSRQSRRGALMADRRPRLAITFPVADGLPVHDALATDYEVMMTRALDPEARVAAMRSADAILVWNWRREVPEGLGPGLPARFVQLVSAGADHLPFGELPPNAVVASNVGAYAAPMAEHVMAMTLALAKRLSANHAKLARGEWDQRTPTATLAGARCAILGYGGIGRAAATLMRVFGARIDAVNTSGRTDDPVDSVGTLDDLDRVLAGADVVVLALPLTRRTRGIIGAAQLGVMKPTAILVNVARGAVIDEKALYDHLVTHPDFSAAIDAWWVEPFRSGEFRVDHPFFDLPNVLGSPHNSGIVAGSLDRAVEAAAENLRRFARGEAVTGIVDPAEYVE